MRGEKGFALVLTLIVTTLMVAVTAELIHQVYVDTAISRGFRDGQQASLLAESGITGGKKLLQTYLSGKEYSSSADKWATPTKLDDETGTIEITVTEESGKICLNDLVMSNGDFEPFTQAALMRLGKRLQIPDDVWSALADWLDSNDEQRPGGAESSYYMTLKPAYRARNNKPLATLSELSLVKGFTPEIVSKLVPFVTVYSEPGSSSLTRSKVNINTAPLEVIAALDKKIDDTLAERVLEERRLRPFKSVAELSRISGLEALSIELGKSATVKGNVFRITSVAQIKDTARTVEAVIWLSGEVLSWQEY